MEQKCLGGMEPAQLQIEAGGLQWNYLEWHPQGQKQILLLHGITSDARAWWRVGAALARAGARVLALDMPGHGRTSHNADGTAFITTAQQVAAFTRALGLAETGYCLAGHSWGGAVSLTLATEHPQGLERVALLDPALAVSSGRAQSLGTEYAEQVGKPKLSRQQYLELSQANQPAWSECDHYWKAAALAAFQPATVRDFYWHNSGQNLIARLSKVLVPLLLMISDEQVGGVIALELQAAARAALRAGSGQAVKLAGVGHNLQREDYAGTMQHLKPFLLG